MISTTRRPRSARPVPARSGDSGCQLAVKRFALGLETQRSLPVANRRKHVSGLMVSSRHGSGCPNVTLAALPPRVIEHQAASCRSSRAETRPGRAAARLQAAAGYAERTNRGSPGGRDHTADASSATVASESSRLGARDERFAADAGRVDRIRGDRFGDGANRSRASQLTRDTPRSARTNHADGRAPTLDPGPRGRPARRGAILRRMPLASSGSVCASPG
jgi:hypothetical protein